MPLRLLIDEDTQYRSLWGLLRERGHDVLTVAEDGLSGQTDAAVLHRARELERIVLTRNGSDFHVLHRSDRRHFGILAIYSESDPAKALTNGEIVEALSRMEESKVDIAGEFTPVNNGVRRSS